MKSRKFVYLSGSIDLAPDYGMSWRKNISDTIRKIGFEIYDPVIRQRKLTGMSIRELKTLRRKNPKLFCEITRKIINVDFNVIAKNTTAVISYIDKHARMGTYSEIGIAYYFKIPIYIIANKSALSGWVVSCVSKIFPSVLAFNKWILEEYRKNKSRIRIFK